MKNKKSRKQKKKVWRKTNIKVPQQNTSLSRSSTLTLSLCDKRRTSGNRQRNGKENPHLIQIQPALLLILGWQQMKLISLLCFSTPFTVREKKKNPRKAKIYMSFKYLKTVMLHKEQKKEWQIITTTMMMMCTTTMNVTKTKKQGESRK